jgi:lysophospholipase L1-like esterase
MNNRTKLLTVLQNRGVSAFSISGTVYDADGTTAVEGATVALGALTATSAANGTYTITDVPAGTSGSVTCTKAGYSWTAISVSAMSGNLTSQNYSNAWWAAGGSAASCVAAYRAIGKAGLLTSYVNDANPGTYDLTVGTKSSFSTQQGFIFLAALNQFLRTGIVPKPIDQSWSAFIALKTGAAVAGIPVGIKDFATSPFPTFWINPNGSNIEYRQVNAVNNTPAAAINTDYTLAFSGRKPYRNGQPDGAGLMGAGSNTNANDAQIFIGGANTGSNTLRDAFTGNVQMVAFYNANLSDAQQAAVHAGAAALKAITYPFYGNYLIGFGDSKTNDSWMLTTTNVINITREAIYNTNIEWQRFVWGEAGRTTAQWAAAIDAKLATYTGTKAPDYILYNMGSNDLPSLPAEATWKADTQYILDAMHTKWSTTTIYMAKINRTDSDYSAQLTSLNSWIDDLVTLNDFVSAGHNETTWMSAGQGTTTDGIHPNTAGYAELVAQWKTVLGYT